VARIAAELSLASTVTLSLPQISKTACRRLYAERTELNDEILNCVDTEDFDGTVTAEGSDAARAMVRPSPPFSCHAGRTDCWTIKRFQLVVIAAFV